MHTHRQAGAAALERSAGIRVALGVFSDLMDPMRRQRIVRLKQPAGITITLLENELDELIECVAHAADRAESAAYKMSGTPKAKSLARERAKRLYALAMRLEDARIDRRQ